MKSKPLLKFELEQAGNSFGVILYILGFLSIVGGVLTSLSFWSSDWVIGVLNLSKGIIEGVLLLIAGSVVGAILQQNIILAHIANELDRQGWDEKEEKKESA